jgi:hypothetical protein
LSTRHTAWPGRKRSAILCLSPVPFATFDGEVRQEFTFVYAAQIESGELKIDDESKEAAWLPLSSAVEVPLAESQRRRIKDVMEYHKEPRGRF